MAREIRRALKGIGAGIIALALVVFAGIACATETAAPAAATTLDNLITAFNGESNANARYLAFAAKADAEGYGPAASLFRAAARAEQVHFERHATLIKKMGGTPLATIETPVVKTTKENLEAAFKGESYEKDTMYPAFLAQAEKENLPAAVDAFEDAQAAEAVHAGLYEKTLADMDALKGPNRDTYVCPICGNVVNAISAEGACGICGTDMMKFITAN